MRTIFYIAAAIYIAAASCAWAGTFDGLAAAASAKPPTPLFLQPGSIVKTEFKSNIRTDSDADLEADFSSVAQACGQEAGTRRSPSPRSLTGKDDPVRWPLLPRPNSLTDLPRKNGCG